MPNKSGFNDELFDLSVAADMTGAPSLPRQLVRPDRILQMIKLSSIVSDSPLQKRIVTFDPEAISDDQVLLEQIKAHGVLQPVIVKQLPGEFGAELKYQMVAGHRRRAAATLAGLEYIPALISKPSDDTSLMTLAENLGTRRLSSYELALSLVDLMKDHSDWDNATISQKTGIPAPTVSNYVCVMNNSCPALVSLYANGIGTRIILALQPIFDALQTDADRSRLAELLNQHEVSFRQIEMVRTMVADGTDPFTAFGLVSPRAKTSKEVVEPDVPAPVNPPDVSSEHPSDGGGQVGEVAEPSAWREPEVELDEDGPAPEPSSEKAPTDQQDPFFSVPDPEDGKKVRAIAAATGLSEQRVKEQVRNALSLGADMNVLTLACLYVAGGGDRQQAVLRAKSVSEHPKVYSMVQKFQANLIKANSLASRLQEDEETREMADFLEKVFGRKLGGFERK